MDTWGEVARDTGILLGALLATCVALVRVIMHPPKANGSVDRLGALMTEYRRLQVDELERLREDLKQDMLRLERRIDDNSRRVDALYGARRSQ